MAYRPTVCWNPAFSSASPPRFTASGAFVLTLTGNAAAVLPVRIEACDGLASPDWSILDRIIISAGGTVTFTDDNAGLFPSRFYRITFPR